MTGHHLEQVIGWYLIASSGGTLLLCGLYRLGHRPQLELRSPRVVVRVEDYLRSAHDCTDVKR